MMHHYSVIDHDSKFKVCPECVSPDGLYKSVQADTYAELQQMEWLKAAKKDMSEGKWPKECSLCHNKEANGVISMRERHNQEHTVHKLIREDYIKVELVVDNLCNGGCQMCHPLASTKVGALYDKQNYPQFDNMAKFNSLPLERLTRLDIIGGEPSYSGIAKNLLRNLPPSVVGTKIITNGSKSLLPEIAPLLERGIEIRLLVSFDGVGPVYNYVRWPVAYEKVLASLREYIEFSKSYPNFTIRLPITVSALNVNDMINIFNVADELGVPGNFCFAYWPLELNPLFANELTLRAKNTLKDSTNTQVIAIRNLIATKENNQLQFDKFVKEQDALRKISINDYIKI
jgi:hypothetical protein